MSLIEWRAGYSVGVESIDHEHRQMIGLINDIYEEMRHRHDTASIEQFLGDVQAAIAAHFALEERVMRDSGYAEYLAHKEDHEELLDQIGEMMDVLSDDPQRGIDLLKQQLSDWFTVHFSTFDARLHDRLHDHH